MEEPWEIELTRSGWRTIKGSPPPISLADLAVLRKRLDIAGGPVETYAVEGRVRSLELISKAENPKCHYSDTSHERDHNRLAHVLAPFRTVLL